MSDIERQARRGARLDKRRAAEKKRVIKEGSGEAPAREVEPMSSTPEIDRKQ